MWQVGNEPWWTQHQVKLLVITARWHEVTVETILHCWMEDISSCMLYLPSCLSFGKPLLFKSASSHWISQLFQHVERFKWETYFKKHLQEMKALKKHFLPSHHKFELYLLMLIWDQKVYLRGKGGRRGIALSIKKNSHSLRNSKMYSHYNFKLTLQSRFRAGHWHFHKCNRFFWILRFFLDDL